MAKKVVRKKAAPKKSGNTFVKKEVISIAAVAVGVFFIVSLWCAGGGKTGELLSQFLRGLFGDASYVMPITLIAASIMAMAGAAALKTGTVLCIPVVLSMLLQLIYRLSADMADGGVKEMFELGTEGHGGGVVGLISELLIWLTGSVGGFIIVIALIIIIIVILFEISVTGLFKTMSRGLKEYFGERARERAEAHEEKKIKIKKKPAEREVELEEYNWAADGLVINDVMANGGENGKGEKHTPPRSEHIPEKTEDSREDAAVQRQEYVDENGEVFPIEVPKEQEKRPEYIFPSTELLYEGPKVHTGGKLELLKENAAKLVEIFASFGIETRVTNITRSSSITRYEVVPAPGIKVNRITTLDQDIALRLPASNVRIEVLPGYVGVEVSNDSVSAVYMRGLLETPEFKNHKSKLAVAVGRDINGNVAVMDIAKTPHLLIAGATGSGKSVCINTIITSILYKAKPEEVKMVMVDPKVVELAMYNGIPHLLIPIVTDPRKAAGALCWAVKEMEERYQKFAEKSVRDLEGYNKKLLEEDENAVILPQIVIIIDEFADLMMVAPGEVQDYICRLAQKARAAGMHLVLATQRPSVDVITGIIKANIPSRISFAVSSAVDSKTILDMGGAEKLMGKGDMLMMLAGMSKPNRVQGAFVSDSDIENLVNFVKSQTTADYSHDILKTIEGSAPDVQTDDDGPDHDELFEDAANIAFELNQISASMLQRRLKVGYARAGRLIDILEKRRVISPYDGSNKPRTLIMSKQEFNEMMEKEK